MLETLERMEQKVPLATLVLTASRDRLGRLDPLALMDHLGLKVNLDSQVGKVLKADKVPLGNQEPRANRESKESKVTKVPRDHKVLLDLLVWPVLLVKWAQMVNRDLKVFRDSLENVVPRVSKEIQGRLVPMDLRVQPDPSGLLDLLGHPATLASTVKMVNPERLANRVLRVTLVALALMEQLVVQASLVPLVIRAGWAHLVKVVLRVNEEQRVQLDREATRDLLVSPEPVELPDLLDQPVKLVIKESRDLLDSRDQLDVTDHRVLRVQSATRAHPDLLDHQQ